MGSASDYSQHVDPEYRRWGRKYPRFPGVTECVRLLRSGKIRGAWVDIVLHELTEHAQECLPELVAAFCSNESEWVRLMVLTAVAQARLPSAIKFLADVVRQRHPRFSPYAEQGLVAIGTREARTALWEAANALDAPSDVEPTL